MTALTAAKVDLVLLALQERQIREAAPQPGEVTPEYLARLASEIGEPVSAGIFRRVEHIAVSKLRHALAETQDETQDTKPQPSSFAFIRVHSR